MRWSKNEDDLIRCALIREAKQIEEDKDLYNRIREQIYIKGRDEDMRKGKIGTKAVLIAIILGVLTSGTILASSLGTVSWERKSLNFYEKVPSQEQLKKEGDFVPKFAKELPGGYTFAMASLEKGELIDKCNKKGVEGNEFTLRYYSKKDKAHTPILTFHASDIDHGFDYHTGEKEIEVDYGVTLYFSDYISRCVSVDYEPTAEDQKKIDNGELSFVLMEADELAKIPANKREEQNQSIKWKEDGIYYYLMPRGGHQCTEKELVDMAKAIIDTQK